MGRFEGRGVLVTGAAGGIGRATAEQFAQGGALVTCADVAAAGADQTATIINAAGGHALGIGCDVTSPESVATAVAAAVGHGGGALHVVANVAGIGGFHHTATLALDVWNRTLAVNLTGTFLVTQACLPHLLATRGAVVNVASVAGVKGQPYCAAYCASKGGVVMFTKALAVEFARQGLRVNCVCPGGVDTNILAGFVPPEGADHELVSRMGLVARLAHPAEIATAITYLASDDAAYCNGTALVLDGGVSA
jgi:NAD(P)-dependent dehydrogenase (short-subunit alcohol dehydrogenase family)